MRRGLPKSTHAAINEKEDPESKSAGAALCFSYDRAFSSSFFFVGEKRRENLSGKDTDKSELK